MKLTPLSEHVNKAWEKLELLKEMLWKLNWKKK